MGCRALLRAAALLLFANIPASAVDIPGLTVVEPPSGSLDADAEAQTTICTFIVEGAYACFGIGCRLWHAQFALRVQAYWNDHLSLGLYYLRNGRKPYIILLQYRAPCNFAYSKHSKQAFDSRHWR